MAAIQLNFTLRTSAHCKTVHLLGSWDNYTGQLPLSKDSSKTGGWKGTFRFQGQTLQQGQRYWYYYIIDGYHVSHDPARDSVVEPTTGRTLNTLDIPAGKESAKSSSRQSRRTSAAVPKGRPLDKSQIVCPRPCKPTETQLVRTMQFSQQTLEQIALQFSASSLEDDSESDSESDAESDVPSLASSVSSASSASSCSCERFGITRAGARVRLDCGGSRCGYSDEECSDDEEIVEEKKTSAYSTRRHGVFIRA